MMLSWDGDHVKSKLNLRRPQVLNLIKKIESVETCWNCCTSMKENNMQSILPE